jgi:endonuclease IV
MNERIKQLWEDSDAIGVRYPEQGSPVSVSATTLEAFAELIVKECIDWCNAHARTDGTAQRIAQDIKKDFGVEE